MPNVKNKKMLEVISQELQNSQGVFVIDYKGLSVKKSQQLRRDL